jgi:hypothetical protein
MLNLCTLQYLNKKTMKRTLFLIVGQNWDYDINPNGKTLAEVIEYFTTHDLKHEHSLKLYQSDSGEYSPGWGQIAYKLIDGVFQSYAYNVDSSG